MSDVLVLDKPDQIRVYQLLVVRSAIRLEAKGLRHSSGLNVRAAWARRFGMRRGSSTEAVLARLDAELLAMGWTPAGTTRDAPDQARTGGSRTPGEGGSL